MLRPLTHIRSNAIAYLALFVALGGTGYAASKIGPSDIERDAIRAKHISRSSVGGLFGSSLVFGHVNFFGAPGGSGRSDALPLNGHESDTTSYDEEGGAQQLLAPVPLRFRHLRVEASGPVERRVEFQIEEVSGDPGPPRVLLGCVMEVGAARCKRAKPSGVLLAGRRAAFRITVPIAAEALTQKSFFYAFRVLPR